MTTTAKMDDELLLAEDIMLLLLPDDGKTSFALSNAKYPLTGAVLVELAMRGFLANRRDEKKDKTYVQAIAGEIPSDPLLAEAFTELGTEEREISTLIDGLVPKIDEVVLSRLAERGIIEHQTSKILWVIPSTSWPEQDPRPEETLRAKLIPILEGQAEPNERSAAIIALLSAADLINNLKPPLPWNKDIKQRVKDIEESTWGSASVADAVEGVMTATNGAMVAVMAATTVATM